jgi:hypothetical protein
LREDQCEIRPNGRCPEVSRRARLHRRERLLKHLLAIESSDPLRPPTPGDFALERRTARGGRDSVDHPVHMHDDLANAAAGALTLAAAPSSADTWIAFAREQALGLRSAPAARPKVPTTYERIR